MNTNPGSYEKMSEMNDYTYDFLVIGSGLAGLSFAIEASRHGRTAILTKGIVTDANTSWAQGGIAAAVGEADSWELHERDTLIAGAGMCDESAVRFLVQHAPEGIEWLKQMGTRFDREHGGSLALGREGGHSRHRIVHHQDRTGWEVERAMSEAVTSRDSVEIFEHAFVSTLLMNEGRCVGLEAHVDILGLRRFYARAVFLATGGSGRLYTHTTNPTVATCDGISLALDAGAKVSNMQFIQFHPTTLYHPQYQSFLISEAVRGAGGTLRNHLGQRFMYFYDPRLELAPRDVVARAINSEMKKHDTWCVYLDTTHMPKDQLQSEFPTIYERLESIGILMERDWIPVVPAQHYSCGGVNTDLQGKTTVPGLYAGGETACTGVHGANRLASNSLLEAMVFSRAASIACQDEPPLPKQMDPVPATVTDAIPESDAVRIRKSMQRLMTKNAGIVRHTRDLQSALHKVRELQAEYDLSPDAPFSAYSYETRNLLKAAEQVLLGSLEMKESVGLYYNPELPQAKFSIDPLPTA